MSNMIPSNRQMLRALGMGESLANIAIPYMAISPATTDPKATQIITLVNAIQRNLFALGATDVPQSGRLDPATVAAIRNVVGDNWERLPWSETVAAVVQAKLDGADLSPPAADDGAPVAVSGALDFLPDVPGGLFTYAVGAFFLLRYLRRR